MAAADPFSQAENFFTKSTPVTSETDSTVNYMVARVLSMNPNGFYAASEMNRLGNGVPKWAVAMLGYTLTPQMSPRRCAYIKKPKSQFTEKAQRIIECIRKMLNCSQAHAEDTYELLKEQKFDFDRYFGQKLAK